MVLAPLSVGFQSLPPLPTIQLGPSCANSRVGGWACAHSRPLWVSPRNCPVRLGVSPTAASTPTGVFNQRFEALFPWAGALGCLVCFALLAVPLGISMWECGAPGSASHHLVGSASCSLACPVHSLLPCWVRQPLPCLESSPPRLPGSAPPTGLDECFFFISLVVRLPYSSIFCQFSFFVFKLLLSSFWLCKEAQCVYLSLCLGQQPMINFLKEDNTEIVCYACRSRGGK